MKKVQSYQQFQPDERIALSSLKTQGLSMRAMARMLNRSPSTISRELARNAPSGQYRCTFAQQRCVRRRLQCRPVAKLARCSALFGRVRAWLARKCSPQQIALHLARHFPHDRAQRVSHETIYNAIYAQPRGELRGELIACLRHARAKQLPRTYGEDRRGKIPDMLSVHVRPPEVADRLFPGH